jgi:hypothetical protein
MSVTPGARPATSDDRVAARRGVAAWLATAALIAVAGGLVVQVVAVARVAWFHVERRDERHVAQAYGELARRWIPADARYAATGQPGRVHAGYALYPNRPVRIHFAGATARELRALLDAHDVRYILVTPPVIPPAFGRRRPWIRELAARRDPHARVLAIDP